MAASKVLLLSLVLVPLLTRAWAQKRGDHDGLCSSYDPEPRKWPSPCSPGGSPYMRWPQLTYLTAKWELNPKSNYGFWFDWECKTSAFKGWGQGGLVKPEGQYYEKACFRHPSVLHYMFEFPKSCPTATSTKDLSCPGEPGCIGIQCFGSMWLLANKYEGMIRGWVDCVNNPFACKDPYRSRLLPPRGLNGPYMAPNIKDVEPPYPKPWPTGLGPLPNP